MSDLKEVLARYVQEQTPSAPPPFDGVGVRARRRSHRRMAAIAAVPVLLAAVGVGTQLARDPAPRRPTAQAPIATAGPGQSVDPQPGSRQTVAPGSSQGPNLPSSFAWCVEGYDLTSLKRRAFAFDGTVSRAVAMQPSSDGSDALAGYLTVTLVVHEWFRGGDQATLTVDMMSGPAPGRVGSPEGTSFGVGTRLLVSGEPRFGGRPLQDAIAWGCGFTRTFDQSTATAWRQAFAKK